MYKGKCATLATNARHSIVHTQCTARDLEWALSSQRIDALIAQDNRRLPNRIERWIENDDRTRTINSKNKKKRLKLLEAHVENLLGERASGGGSIPTIERRQSTANWQKSVVTNHWQRGTKRHRAQLLVAPKTLIKTRFKLAHHPQSMKLAALERVWATVRSAMVAQGLLWSSTETEERPPGRRRALVSRAGARADRNTNFISVQQTTSFSPRRRSHWAADVLHPRRVAFWVFLTV